MRTLSTGRRLELATYSGSAIASARRGSTGAILEETPSPKQVSGDSQQAIDGDRIMTFAAHVVIRSGMPGSFIEVRRAVVMGEVTTTKSHKIRRVDMSPQLAGTLQGLKEVRQLEAMAQAKPLPEWVFLSSEGMRWDERNLRRGWYRLLSQGGIGRVRFHDLRHTWVSLLIQTGAHAKYIQEQAGHSSIQVTRDRPYVCRNRINTGDEVDRGAKNRPPVRPIPGG